VIRPKIVRIGFSTLFSRLILYFIVVMLIPIILLSIYYIATGKRTLMRNLSEQGDVNIIQAAGQFRNIVESYRHKAYTISINEKIIQELHTDSPESRSARSTGIYEELFRIMRGDTYLASASIVSNSGKARYSTHLFPERYDLRYQGNDTNPFFDLARASSETASIMTMGNRYATQSNSFVFLNILRRVRNEAGADVGYVVVDIFQEAISHLSATSAFNDLVLIDSENFIATSLTHTDRYGDFSKFPELAAISTPFEEKSYTKENTIVSLAFIPNSPLILAGITDSSSYHQTIEHFFLIIVIVTILGTILAGIFAYFFSRSIAHPVNKLAASMQLVESGNLQVRVQESKILEIGQLDKTFNAMIGQITSLLELTREEEAKLHEAERKALESQMNPHFLYNTLNTVKAIAKLHGEQEILTITMKLGKLLRSSIDNRDAEITLRDSFALTESYLTIQKIRFGEKLHVVSYLDEALQEERTPKLIIQPLVENAIIHGLEPKVGNWRISIKAILRSKMVVLTIADNGIGMAQGTLPKNLDDLAGSEHVGIYNIHRRLILRYGEKASLKIDSIEGEGTIITIIFPSSVKTGE
jgi:two-component system, sensor histidine kinase YesM